MGLRSPWRLILCIFPVRPQGPGFSLSLWLEGEFEGKPLVGSHAGRCFPRDAQLKKKLSRTICLKDEYRDFSRWLISVVLSYRSS